MLFLFVVFTIDKDNVIIQSPTLEEGIIENKIIESEIIENDQESFDKKTDKIDEALIVKNQYNKAQKSKKKAINKFLTNNFNKIKNKKHVLSAIIVCIALIVFALYIYNKYKTPRNNRGEYKPDNNSGKSSDEKPDYTLSDEGGEKSDNIHSDENSDKKSNYTLSDGSDEKPDNKGSDENSDKKSNYTLSDSSKKQLHEIFDSFINIDHTNNTHSNIMDILIKGIQATQKEQDIKNTIKNNLNTLLNDNKSTICTKEQSGHEHEDEHDIYNENQFNTDYEQHVFLLNNNLDALLNEIFAENNDSDGQTDSASLLFNAMTDINSNSNGIYQKMLLNIEDTNIKNAISFIKQQNTNHNTQYALNVICDLLSVPSNTELNVICDLLSVPSNTELNKQAFEYIINFTSQHEDIKLSNNINFKKCTITDQLFHSIKNVLDLQSSKVQKERLNKAFTIRMLDKIKNTNTNIKISKNDTTNAMKNKIQDSKEMKNICEFFTTFIKSAAAGTLKDINNSAINKNKPCLEVSYTQKKQDYQVILGYPSDKNKKAYFLAALNFYLEISYHNNEINNDGIDTDTLLTTLVNNDGIDTDTLLTTLVDLYNTSYNLEFKGLVKQNNDKTKLQSKINVYTELLSKKSNNIAKEKLILYSLYHVIYGRGVNDKFLTLYNLKTVWHK